MITNTELKKYHNKNHEKEINLKDGHGLFARVNKKGGIYWRFRYTVLGKQKWFTIGDFPSVSLKEAREQAILCKSQVSKGLDPAVERRRIMSEELESMTLHECYEVFIAHRGKTLDESTLRDYKNTFENHVPKGKFGRVNSISIKEWYRFFDTKFETGKAANFNAKKIKACLRWCFERQYIERPSILDIPTKNIGEAPEEGQRVLTLKEVELFLKGLEKDTAAPISKKCIAWMILFGCRISEARTVEFSDLDLDSRIWTIPKDKSKTGNVIRHPIPDIVIQFLESLPWDVGWVFPGRKEGECLQRNSVYGTVKRIIKNEGLKDFSPHDFRRTIATRLSEQGVYPHVIEKILGHVMEGVMAVYNKHDWIDDQNKAYELWAKLLPLKVAL